MTTTYKAQGFLGRQADGSRVFVELTLKRVERAGTTTDHAPISEYVELAIQGAWVEKGHRNASAWGQLTDDTAKVINPAPGLTSTDIRTLADIWQRWHLNGMNGACAHQREAQTAALKAGKTASEMLDTIPPCPETGYKYGHAWLVDALPVEVADAVRRIGDRLNGEMPS